ncbi:acyl-CoA transferase [Streptomyces dysideae]|uniref:Acyl-CoA transferase n=2 Tax=Streptomyces dysideae TaxID=909626 RepID=A0A101UT61_9ACTN|nr:acyl-CoA transferase [Streptomyces dysideae]
MIATYMGEYGADVIKVEQPGSGDPIRQWGANKGDINLMWKSLGRNKRCVSLNLRVEAGQELFRRLAAEIDVVILNARPSALERWGISYEDLASRNEGLVMIHVTGYGAGGPYSDKAGFGTISEAMSGFAHITGEADGPPTLPGFMLADCTAAVHGAFAVSAALLHRERTGQGQLIDLSLLEPLARFAEQATLTYDQLGKIPGRVGNKWAISVPRNTYKTGDGHWIALSGSAQSVALKVFDAIGRPELREDPEYADPLRRIVNRDAVDDLIADWIRQRSLQTVMQQFDDHGVAAGPVYNAQQLMADPHLKARGTFVPVKDEDLDEVRVQAPVARMSQTPGVIRYLGRSVGQDNRDVLHELLGVGDEEFKRLDDGGAL